MCIGAQRAGTTWLHNLLASHPRVYVPTRRKEIHYYDWYYHRGLNWYRSFFPHQNQAQKYAALGEVTPDYLYESEAPKRIAETNPEIKLIVMLRNPIDRAFSHYRLLVRDYNCTTSFRDIIRENGDVVQRGFYSRYLKPFRQVFGPGRILPLIFEKVLGDFSSSRRSLATFLGVDENGFDSEASGKIYNASDIPRFSGAYAAMTKLSRLMHRLDLDFVVSAAKRLRITELFGLRRIDAEMDPEEERYLFEIYHKDIEATEQMIGVSLDCWREKSKDGVSS